MESEDSSQQPTQPCDNDRRLGGHGSGISESDLLDVICILSPSTPAAHRVIKANIPENCQHIIPNHDLPCDSLEDLPEQSRSIALRMSSPVKSPEMGFVFGRLAELCDVALHSGQVSPTISGRHFRIYMKADGVLMLQDTSSNGTTVDGNILCLKTTGLSSRILGNGSSIVIYQSGGSSIEFLVRIPGRREHQKAYYANLRKYLANFQGAKPRSVLANPENTHGMKWNGGSKYNVVGVLGRGAFATVYKIADQRDGSAFAAKELNTSRYIKNGILDIKFDNEIRIMKDLRHENIVKYVDYHHHEEWIYLIMELVPHGELLTYLNERGPLPEPFVQVVARQVSCALAFLHARGITHRDIKPDNILVAEEDPLKVKLSDFGLSKSVADNNTFLKTFCGTLLYCAPEIYPDYMSYDSVIGGKRSRPKDHLPKKYSNRVDIWSLGAVLFHLVCKEAPFSAGRGRDKAGAMLESIMQTPVGYETMTGRGVSHEGQDFIGSLLQRNPVDRPSARACLQHAWIFQPDDPTGIDEADPGHESYFQNGLPLATVDEIDEESQSQAEVVYPAINLDNDSDERNFKRPRFFPGVNAPGPVLETLPQYVRQTQPANNQAGGRRLFGEVTPSLLKSSGVFPEAYSEVDESGSALAEFDLEQGMEAVGFDENVATEMADGVGQESGPSESESILPPRHMTRLLPDPSCAPSLLGAERGIKNLNMASLEGVHSEVTTPDGHKPTTPQTRELTPSSNQASQSDNGFLYESLTGRAEDDASHYISLGAPREMADDGSVVEQQETNQAANAARPAENLQAQTFAGQGSPKTGKGNLLRSTSLDSVEKINRRIDLPSMSSLHPALDDSNNMFAKPGRRFGKLSTVSGSHVDLTVCLEHHNTYWGHGLDCKSPFPDKNDPRVPKHVFQIMFHATDMNEVLRKKKPWWTATGIRTVIASRSPGGILINGVHLRSESEKERCAYYGKIYTGDIITVFPLENQSGAFLRFHIEINYGDSAKARPKGEEGFQVRKETNHHRRELARRKSRKSMRTEGKQVAAEPSTTKAT